MFSKCSVPWNKGDHKCLLSVHLASYTWPDLPGHCSLKLEVWKSWEQGYGNGTPVLCEPKIWLLAVAEAVAWRLDIESQVSVGILPAGHRRSAWPAGPMIGLRFPHLSVCWSVRPRLSRVLIMSHTLLPCELYFCQLQQFGWLLCNCVATMSSLAQLRVGDRRWEAEAM